MPLPILANRTSKQSLDGFLEVLGVEGTFLFFFPFGFLVPTKSWSTILRNSQVMACASVPFFGWFQEGSPPSGRPRTVWTHTPRTAKASNTANPHFDTCKNKLNPCNGFVIFVIPLPDSNQFPKAASRSELSRSTSDGAYGIYAPRWTLDATWFGGCFVGVLGFCWLFVLLGLFGVVEGC